MEYYAWEGMKNENDAMHKNSAKIGHTINRPNSRSFNGGAVIKEKSVSNRTHPDFQVG